jgi:hypothetical protein
MLLPRRTIPNPSVAGNSCLAPRLRRRCQAGLSQRRHAPRITPVRAGTNRTAAGGPTPALAAQPLPGPSPKQTRQERHTKSSAATKGDR